MIDSIPPGALQDLSTITGKPWDLITRRTLDAIAKPIQDHRVNHHDWVGKDFTPAPAWHAIQYGQKEIFSTWPGLLVELERLILDLHSIRGRKYPAVASPDDARPQDLQPDGTQACPAAIVLTDDALKDGDVEKHSRKAECQALNQPRSAAR